MDASARSARIKDFAYLVEQQLGSGIELILSARRDRQYGPLPVVGMGGIYTELLADAAIELLPSSDMRLSAALRSLRGWRP